MDEINGGSRKIMNDKPVAHQQYTERNESESCKKIPKFQRLQIEVAMIEFHNSGNTIWVQSPEGATILRIKCSGKINVEQCRDSPSSHCDIYVEGDINFCVSKDAK